MSGGCLKGMSRCNSAMRGETTIACSRVPLCCSTSASGLFGAPRSICAVKGWRLHWPLTTMSFRREGEWIW